MHYEIKINTKNNSGLTTSLSFPIAYGPDSNITNDLLGFLEKHYEHISNLLNLNHYLPDVLVLNHIPNNPPFPGDDSIRQVVLNFFMKKRYDRDRDEAIAFYQHYYKF